MPTTNRQGLPYPDPTDPVAQGADAIRALAETVDVSTIRNASRANGVSVEWTGAAFVLDVDSAVRDAVPRAGVIALATDGEGYTSIPIPPDLRLISATWAADTFGARVCHIHANGFQIRVMEGGGTPARWAEGAIAFLAVPRSLVRTVDDDVAAPLPELEVDLDAAPAPLELEEG